MAMGTNTAANCGVLEIEMGDCDLWDCVSPDDYSAVFEIFMEESKLLGERCCSGNATVREKSTLTKFLVELGVLQVTLSEGNKEGRLLSTVKVSIPVKEDKFSQSDAKPNLTGSNLNQDLGKEASAENLDACEEHRDSDSGDSYDAGDDIDHEVVPDGMQKSPPVEQNKEAILDAKEQQECPNCKAIFHDPWDFDMHSLQCDRVVGPKLRRDESLFTCDLCDMMMKRKDMLFHLFKAHGFPYEEAVTKIPSFRTVPCQKVKSKSPMKSNKVSSVPCNFHPCNPCSCPLCDKVMLKRKDTLMHLYKCHGLSYEEAFQKLSRVPAKKSKPSQAKEHATGQILKSTDAEKESDKVVEPKQRRRDESLLTCDLCDTVVKRRDMLFHFFEVHRLPYEEAVEKIPGFRKVTSRNATTSSPSRSKQVHSAPYNSNFRCLHCAKVMLKRRDMLIHLYKCHGLSYEEAVQEFPAKKRKLKASQKEELNGTDDENQKVPAKKRKRKQHAKGHEPNSTDAEIQCDKEAEPKPRREDSQLTCDLCNMAMKRRNMLFHLFKVHGLPYKKAVEKIPGFRVVPSRKATQSSRMKPKRVDAVRRNSSCPCSCPLCDKVMLKRENMLLHLYKCHGFSYEEALQKLPAKKIKPRRAECDKMVGLKRRDESLLTCKQCNVMVKRRNMLFHHFKTHGLPYEEAVQKIPGFRAVPSRTVTPSSPIKSKRVHSVPYNPRSRSCPLCDKVMMKTKNILLHLYKCHGLSYKEAVKKFPSMSAKKNKSKPTSPKQHAKGYLLGNREGSCERPKVKSKRQKPEQKQSSQNGEPRTSSFIQMKKAVIKLDKIDDEVFKRLLLNEENREKNSQCSDVRETDGQELGSWRSPIADVNQGRDGPEFPSECSDTDIRVVPEEEGHTNRDRAVSKIPSGLLRSKDIGVLPEENRHTHEPKVHGIAVEKDDIKIASNSSVHSKAESQTSALPDRQSQSGITDLDEPQSSSTSCSTTENRYGSTANLSPVAVATAVVLDCQGSDHNPAVITLPAKVSGCDVDLVSEALFTALYSQDIE